MSTKLFPEKSLYNNGPFKTYAGCNLDGKEGEWEINVSQGFANIVLNNDSYYTIGCFLDEGNHSVKTIFRGIWYDSFSDEYKVCSEVFSGSSRGVFAIRDIEEYAGPDLSDSAYMFRSGGC